MSGAGKDLRLELLPEAGHHREHDYQGSNAHCHGGDGYDGDDGDHHLLSLCAQIPKGDEEFVGHVTVVGDQWSVVRVVIFRAAPAGH